MYGDESVDVVWKCGFIFVVAALLIIPHSTLIEASLAIGGPLVLVRLQIMM